MRWQETLEKFRTYKKSHPDATKKETCKAIGIGNSTYGYAISQERLHKSAPTTKRATTIVAADIPRINNKVIALIGDRETITRMLNL